MTQRPEYIGCIDGNTIVLSHRNDEFVLSFGGIEARLSIEAAFRLASLLQPTASIPASSENKPQPVRPSVKRKRYSRYRETISDLIEEGLIEVGTVLIIKHKYTERSGTVTSDGMINVDGYIEATPSAAGSRVVDRTCNGWQEWRVYGGPRLADLRWMLRAKRFPGESHGYAESTAREKQMIVTGWVDYTLTRGLDPGKKGNAKTEAYLSDRQRKSDYRYTESTLNVYRGHLRHWFDWCGDNNW